MSITAQGIQIGLLTLSFYGFIIVLAVILSMILVNRRLLARQLDTRYLFPLTITILITAILGARIWYTCFPPPAALRVGLTAAFYWHSMLDFFTFWQGGFALPGCDSRRIDGFGFLIFVWRHKLTIKKWLRATSIVIPFSTASFFGEISSTITTTACLLRCPGRSRSNLLTVCLDILLWPPTIRSSYTNRYGHCWSRRLRLCMSAKPIKIG